MFKELLPRRLLKISCLITRQVQSTPNNSNLQGKSKKVRVSWGSSYREYEENNRKGGNGMGKNASNIHTSKLDKYTGLENVFKPD